MAENERLTFETELGISIDKNEDCPTMSICWNCDIKVKDCKYFNDVIEKLANFEAIGTIEEFKALKEMNVEKKPRFYAHNYYCTECGNLVGYTEFEWQRFLYCDKCGQKIDWQ